MNTHRTLDAWSLCAAVGLIAVAFAAGAQQSQAPPANHSMMSHPADPASSPSTLAFQKGNERMMKGMSGPYTGDTDRDFVSQMIAHHQGAIDMAQVQLQYGKDPQLRRLSRNIIRAQRKEIDEMKRWQEKHAAK